jgi:acyl-coenzyme A thioesterase PaaI-like protein
MARLFSIVTSCESRARRAGRQGNRHRQAAYVGRTSQVWDIRLHDGNEVYKLTCVSRLTMAVIQRK